MRSAVGILLVTRAYCASVAPKEDACSAEWAQCGGTGWEGVQCCGGPAKCIVSNDDYSQCIVSAPKWDHCDQWLLCQDGFTCTVTNEGLQCLPDEQIEKTQVKLSEEKKDDGCSAEWGQCGGTDWEGAQCCESPAKCTFSNDYYSQCIVCAPKWDQCGGTDWDGLTCCQEGSTCIVTNEWYSQCLPDGQIEKTQVKLSEEKKDDGCSAEWGQCGGTGWEGPQCCQQPAQCKPQDGNEWYSQCVVCASVWSQCGGTGWDGLTCCQAGSTCLAEENNLFYLQCLPHEKVMTAIHV